MPRWKFAEGRIFFTYSPKPPPENTLKYSISSIITMTMPVIIRVSMVMSLKNSIPVKITSAVLAVSDKVHLL
jgi:hypothetical protein